MTNPRFPEEFQSKRSEREITVTKLEAAKRQLDTAIDLSFADGDPVAVLSLAYSSYEIIHRLFRKRGFKDEMIYDNPDIPEAHRKEWSLRLKSAPNFLKHSNRGDPNEATTFYEIQCDLFMLFSCTALEKMGVALGPMHKTLAAWGTLHFPSRDMLGALENSGFKIDQLPKMQSLSRAQFLKMFLVHLKKQG